MRVQAGLVLVTVGYFLLWYFLLIGLQRRTKYRLQREYAARGQVFDRYFGNDEQMLAESRRHDRRRLDDIDAVFGQVPQDLRRPHRARGC